MNKTKKFKLSTVILLILFVYLAYTAIGQQKIIYAKNIELKKQEAKVAEETDTNTSLKSQQEKLKSDEYYEEVAREKLGMIKQNEKVFIDIGK